MEKSHILRVEGVQTGCDGWTLPLVKIYGNITYFDGRECAGRMKRMDPSRSISMEMSRILRVESVQAG